MLQEYAVLLPTTESSFDESAYLRGNPDVAEAVRAGRMPSGRVHFERHGARLKRYMCFTEGISALREIKLNRLRPLLELSLTHKESNGIYDFLTDQLRAETRIVDTDRVSAHPYDGRIMDLVRRHADGLVLDCGAGHRNVYFSNVVNLEIAPYPTTDVLAVGEKLPFKDGSFDAVISVAVLEHVRDPFVCAREIARVLKPGGELYCTVPFLQPQHGYPHHYYNMAPQGLRALFEDYLSIESHDVTDFIGPIHALVWILAAWSKGLEGSTKEEFLDMRVRDFMSGAPSFHKSAFVTELTKEKNFELACATTIRAVKDKDLQS